MYQSVYRLSRGMALLGGLMLSLLIVIICISISGRILNGVLHSDMIMSMAPDIARWFIDIGVGPVYGDFELVEVGMAFSIFAFIPYCQITGGHASVDVFTSKLPPRANKILQVLIDMLFAAVLVLIAVQLNAGMLSKLNSGQTSLLLEFPVWWGYAISLSGAIAAALVGVFIAAMRLTEMISGREYLPHMEGADH